jgi:hypothetical protein
LKPKLLVLNVALAIAVCAIGWQARVRWNEAQELRRTTLNVRVSPAHQPPPIPVPQPETPPAVKYEDVAKKNLFSSDRNPDIVVDPPPVVVAKPMPPLPIASGVMSLPSGVKAFMAEKPGQQMQMVRLNDRIGEFKIVALDVKNVTFDWDGRQITKRIEDLIDRSSDQVASNSGPAAGPNLPPPPPSMAVQQKPLDQNQPPGKDMGQGVRSCAAGDNTPAGTIVDGYKKFSEPTPFGPICRWVKQ